MEDIQRDIQKELDSYKVSKSSRKGRHWTLLFVSEQGEVITIQKFKGLMLLAVFILLVALSVAASIYMLYKKPFAENSRLVAQLSEIKERVAALGTERDLLLTRLGIVEARVKKAGKPETADKKAGKPETADKKAGKPETADKKAGKPETADKKAGKVAAEKQPADVPEAANPAPVKPLPENEKTGTEPEYERQSRASQPEEAESEEKPEIKVDVSDLQVKHEPELNQLNVQFRLKNVNIAAGAVSGRTFVVLKTDSEDVKDILTFPKVTLAGGRPARIYLGRYFSISRFNIVKFKSEYDQDPRPFSSATVFVYSGAGDLLLEKIFSIENPFKNTATAAPETDGNQTEEAGETDGGPEGFEINNNTILNN